MAFTEMYVKVRSVRVPVTADPVPLRITHPAYLAAPTLYFLGGATA